MALPVRRLAVAVALFAGTAEGSASAAVVAAQADRPDCKPSAEDCYDAVRPD